MAKNAKKSVAKKSSKKAAKPAAKKSATKKSATKKVAKPLGYKGHRAGTAKEKLHQLYDKLGWEKGMKEALKLKGVAVNTVRTSFSQFRHAA